MIISKLSTCTDNNYKFALLFQNFKHDKQCNFIDYKGVKKSSTFSHLKSQNPGNVINLA